MLSDIIHTLEPLASSRALHLVIGLYASGALLLLSPDERLLVPLFLAQRGIVIVLLWSSIGLELVGIHAAASVAAGLIYLITVWYLYRRAPAAVARAARGAQPLTHLPLRALAVALALLLTYGLVQKYAPSLLPPLVSWSVAWLLVEFCFAVLLAPSPLHTGLGVLAFADAGRILYALTRPDALVWGVWAACDVLVALAAAHLRSVEVAAYGAKKTHRRERGGRRENAKISAAQDEALAASPGVSQAEEGTAEAAPHEASTDSSAFSAVSALKTGPDEAEPSPGDKP